MSIVRYENVEVYNVVDTVSDYGVQHSSLTLWFSLKALVHDLANSLRISDRYRVYSDLAQFTMNYTPNMKTIVDHQDLYAFKWRGFEWRITDCRESNDRMKVTFVCYRNDPASPV